MPWTQVYVSGLARSVAPSDEEIETLLAARCSISAEKRDGSEADDQDLQWAGPGSTLIKRDAAGACRGYVFLTFYSADGADVAAGRINEDSETTGLRAELSNPKARKKKMIGGETGLPDVRLRRQRKAPVRKHPVIVNSDKSKTGLGNKTK